MNNLNDRAKDFDLIAFDWDGTLSDSTPVITRCIQAAIRDVGGVVPNNKQASWVIGMNLLEALSYLAPDLAPSRYDDLKQRYRMHYSEFSNSIALFSGALQMLVKLKETGIKLAIATGKSRRELDKLLNNVSLQALFDASRTSDETAGKPNPLMLHELMQELDVPAKRVLVIGDTTHDLQMAHNAGCSSVGVSYGAHSRELLLELNPLFVADSVYILHSWLLNRA